MYMLLVQYKGGKKKAIYHDTLREAYDHYKGWKDDKRCLRVTLFAADWLHLTTYHPEAGEEQDETNIMFLGRGEGTP